tara:strand:- start:547 stop:687 length:141 start_codon:yes stop_codon:yes gene_type:complete
LGLKPANLQTPAAIVENFVVADSLQPPGDNVALGKSNGEFYPEGGG